MPAALGQPDMLGRVTAQNLFPNPLQHPAGLHITGVGGRGNQTRERRGGAVDIILNVVSDDAQGPGLGCRDR